jgi:hypothetical protein
MGLENGIVLHTKESVKFPAEIDSRAWEFSTESDIFPYHYELCFWRKCWNLRSEIGHALQAQDMEYVAKAWLTIADVKNIWHAIQQLYSKRAWESGNSIWTWSEIKDLLTRDFLILEWLISFMRQHDESEYLVEFYDSY